MNSGKLDKAGGESDFIRKVVNGACDEVLQTPLGEIAVERKDISQPVKVACWRLVACQDFLSGGAEKCKSCQHRLRQGHYYERSETFEEGESDG